MNKWNLIVSTVIICVFYASSSFAEVAVIVHPSNSNTLSIQDIQFIYLGKKKSFPNGDEAVPVSLIESASTTVEFNDKVLKKSSSQLRAYWSKLVFTGKGSPPKAVEADAELVNLVASNPNLIGYVDSASISGDVKVVGKF